MFTGLIEATATVVSITPTTGATRLVLAAPAFVGRWSTGDSIAVNGVCLTAMPVEGPDSSTIDPNRFAADLAAETLLRTTLAFLNPGGTVNLELPTPAGSPLGGHVVQGHVDATGSVISLAPLHPDLDNTDWRLSLELPPQLRQQVISQGSITIDGISLTVARADFADPDHLRVEIAVIPHTYRFTNLHTLEPGSRVNIETDVLAKYAAAQRSSAQKDWLTSSYLLANGY
jgi:riboflavin synthase